MTRHDPNTQLECLRWDRPFGRIYAFMNLDSCGVIYNYRTIANQTKERMKLIIREIVPVTLAISLYV